MKTSLLLPVIMLLYLSNGAAQTNNTLLPPTYTAAYGYIITSPTYPQGPCKFFLEAPDSLIFLAPTTSPTPIHTSAWANSTWYGAEDLNPSMGLNHGHLYSINTTTGAMTDIGPLGVSISGMAYDHTTGTMYGISSLPSVLGTYVTKIYRISLATGQTTLLTNFGNSMGHCISLSCNNAGMLFTVNDMAGKRCAIDPLTWTYEFYTNAPAGMDYLTDAEINKNNDQVYFTRNNTATGALVTPSTILNFPLNTQVTAMAIPFTYNTPTTDGGVMWLVWPSVGSTSSADPVMVEIRNYGTVPISNFDVCYSFDNQAPICENYNIFGGGPITPGNIYDYVFIPFVNCYPSFCIKAWISQITGDINQVNDTTSKCSQATSCSFSCFPNSITEPEPCGSTSDDGCFAVPNLFIQATIGEVYCGTSWKVDSLIDSDWYQFNVTGTQSIVVTAKAEFDLQLMVVKLPCSLDSLCGQKVIPACTTDSLFVFNLTQGTYAIIITPDILNYNIFCGGNTQYSFKFNTTNCAYCAAGAISGGVGTSFISNVTVTPGSVNNSTNWSPGGYAYYPNMVTNMSVGSSYTIFFTNGGIPATWPGSYNAVYIDWNQDCDFDDPGEIITITPNSGGPTMSGTITPPSYALPGLTRMRVRIGPGPLLPCGTTAVGEVEDYNINVIPANPIVTTSIPAANLCAGTAEIPVNVSSMPYVNGFNLKLKLPTGLTYQGFSNLNATLLPQNLNITSSGDTVWLNYFSLTSAGPIPSGILLNLVVAAVPGIYNLVWNPGTPGSGYSSISQGQFQSLYSNGIVTITGCGSIDGFVKYDNNLLSPLTDSTHVILTPPLPGGPICNPVDVTGHFIFPTLAPGNYSLTAQSTKKWGGGNAIDALKILQNFVGQSSLAGIRLIAADVNNSGSVNSADALKVLQRFVGAVTSFSSGDWAAETISVNLTGSNSVSQDLKALCYGDVNGSFLPFAKSAERPQLTYEGALDPSAGKLVIPVRFSTQMAGISSLGAISLVLEMPEGLMIDNIVPAAVLAGDYFLYKTHGNILRLAWCRPEGSNLKDGDLLFTIYTNIHALSSWEFAMRAESNFADVQGNAIAGAGISLPKLSTKGSSFSLSQNQPNPFAGETRISYDLPEDCQVKLTILDPLGRIIKTLVTEANTAGHHVVAFDGNSLSPGVYLYELRAAGSVRTYQSTKMMLIEN